MAEKPSYQLPQLPPRPLGFAAPMNDLPIPGTFIPQPPPRKTIDEIMRGLSYGISQDIGQAGSSVARALMTPGNAMRGDYNEVSIYPSGYVSPVSEALIQDASNMAGVVTTGSMPMPRPMNSLGMGGRLPSSQSLNTPPVPTPEQMSKLGRVETVPLSQARSTQSKMDWDKFGKGEHPPELVKGYADKPVAVRKEDGEYLIFDGHHRTAAAMEKGVNSMDMYVIDARDYAPYAAGRKPAAPSISDEELLRLLGL